MPHQKKLLSVTPWTQSVIHTTLGRPKSSIKLQLRLQGTLPRPSERSVNIRPCGRGSRQAGPANGSNWGSNGEWKRLNGEKITRGRGYRFRIILRSSLTRDFNSSLASIKFVSS